ncbi:MAG: ribonuclease R [Clostridiales bacterium]|nr:ribonuclease R [Clostridiales bacterium]
MTQKKKLLSLIDKNSLVFSNVDKLFLFLSSALDTDIEKVKKLFYSLVSNGDIYEIRRNKFISIPSHGYVKGEFFGTAKGFGFVKVDGFKEDIFIPANKTNGALDGEKVIVKIMSQSGDGTDGEVVSIYEELQSIVGAVTIVANNYFLDPDNNKIPLQLPIIKTGLKLQKNMKVMARIVRTEKGKIKCAVHEILGFEDDVKALELSIVREHNLFEKFPDSVVEAEKKVPKTVSAQQKKGRLDLTGETIFTIDGADAKDLDDAINIKKFDTYYELGVHIADVGEYVKQGNVFDDEAYKRGTSVYFPTSVLPMLPKSLSNGICSLNEGVERLTLSCIMKVDFNGKVIDYKICESFIKSVARLTYKEVYQALTGGELNEKTQKLQKDFLLMRELCDILESNTEKRGALDLDVPEVQFVFDADGMAVDLTRRERNSAHRLIEDFMVLANETIARHFNKLGIPFVYRVHEAPTKEKVYGVCDFLKGIGIPYPQVPDDIKPAYFQEILDNVETLASKDVVNKVVLRSMQKAKYANKNLGHFGLALVDYCHFTSPIRRYPDLTIHRIIKEWLHGKLSTLRKEELDEFAFEAAEQSSACERNADYAERDVDDLWKAYLMKDKIGQEFEATISSVTNFGIFVALDNTVEGLIKIEELPEDAYLFLEKQLKLKGSAHLYSLGDRVKVVLTNVNLQTRNIDFKIVED